MLIPATLQRRADAVLPVTRAPDRSSIGCGTPFTIAACRRSANGWHWETDADSKFVALRNSVGHPGNAGLGYFRHRAFDLRSERDLCGVNLGRAGEMPQSCANSGNIGEAIARHVHMSWTSTGSSMRAADRQRSLNSWRMQGASSKWVVMLHKTVAVLAIALALGSSALSTSAFARGGGHGGSGGFGGARMAGSACGGYGARVSGLHGGFHAYGRRDVWGHWGAYYGPMIPMI
jgi:hypothetical protein